MCVCLCNVWFLVYWKCIIQMHHTIFVQIIFSIYSFVWGVRRAATIGWNGWVKLRFRSDEKPKTTIQGAGVKRIRNENKKPNWTYMNTQSEMNIKHQMQSQQTDENEPVKKKKYCNVNLINSIAMGYGGIFCVCMCMKKAKKSSALTWNHFYIFNLADSHTVIYAVHWCSSMVMHII